MIPLIFGDISQVGRGGGICSRDTFTDGIPFEFGI